MGGGLMQLVAYGAQDIYLTGNPQITFFKVVYRRHTNFAMESIEQTFNGTPAACSRVSCTISRNGDLVHKMHLRLNVSETTECVCTALSLSGVWVAGSDAATHAALAAAAFPSPLPTNVSGIQENCANDVIKSVEIEIGGQRIDKHYGDWLNIWAELTTPSSKVHGLREMLNTTDGKYAYIPLRFWFNRNPGLALPLIALQYHEVKLNIEFAGTATCGVNGCVSAPTSKLGSSTKLYVDYIYLDTDERRRFAQVSHEYLIEQLQFTGTKSIGGDTNERLNFNHPVKELVWRANIVEGSGTEGDCVKLQWSDITLQLNGHERFAPRHSEYFRLVQPYEHHTSVPVKSGIHCYSFALKPEEHQPSGTCNFSRIDNAVLKLTGASTAIGGDDVSGSNTANLNIYAVNYNVLRIMSGMGGLAYSN